MTVYILGSARTPIGSFMGELSTVPATTLGSTVCKSLVEQVDIDPSAIDGVVMGNVLSSGLGQAPARQCALEAGLPNSVPCITVNKVCGSGLKTVMMAAQAIKAGDNELMIAGGMENMSLAPYLSPSMRVGNKLGSVSVHDSIMNDGLTDAYRKEAMGVLTEECAEKYGFSREEQDAFAIDSIEKARRSQEEKIFDDEITPVTIQTRKGEIVVSEDEEPKNARPEKIAKLRPVFKKDGTITPANASSINDGAAAVLVGGERYKNLAQFKIVAYSEHAHEPTWFSTAPVASIRKVLEKASLSLEDIDLFEINEAFSVVTMAAVKELEIPMEKVNVHGGAVALGHPIGASGARILVTLINAMNKQGKNRGLASICIGGGEAVSMIIERV